VCFFVFSAYGRKFKPPALQVVGDFSALPLHFRRMQRMGIKKSGRSLNLQPL